MPEFIRKLDQIVLPKGERSTEIRKQVDVEQFFGLDIPDVRSHMLHRIDLLIDQLKENTSKKIAIFFLDKSARPYAHLFRKRWLFRQKTESLPTSPFIHFIQGRWVEKHTEEIENKCKKESYEKIWIVDDTLHTGRTLRAVKQAFNEKNIHFFPVVDLQNEDQRERFMAEKIVGQLLKDYTPWRLFEGTQSVVDNFSKLHSVSLSKIDEKTLSILKDSLYRTCSDFTKICLKLSRLPDRRIQELMGSLQLDSGVDPIH